MKVIVVSDSHHNKEILEQIVIKHPDASLFLHAGDSCLSAPEIAPYLSVKGNCDNEEYPKERAIQTPYGLLVIMHGHQLFLNHQRFIQKKQAKILIVGHTHQHKVVQYGDAYVFNPGSVSLPRDKTNGTYLILNIEKESITYEFVDM